MSDYQLSKDLKRKLYKAQFSKEVIMLVNNYEMPFIGLILGLNFVILFMFFYVAVKVSDQPLVS